MTTKISAPAVSRYLSRQGVTVTPSAADLSLGGVRVTSSRATGEVVVSVTLAVGLQAQEQRLAAVIADILRQGPFEVRVGEIDSSFLYVSKEA